MRPCLANTSPDVFYFYFLPDFSSVIFFGKCGPPKALSLGEKKTLVRSWNRRVEHMCAKFQGLSLKNAVDI